MQRTIKVEYLGGLKCVMTHEQSGTQWISDAPKDNNGDGRSFSPTDMLSASLASCFMTIMGISARNHNIDIEGATIDVTKHMTSGPRRIGQIDLKIKMPERSYSEREKEIINKAAESCPVSRSIHSDLVVNFGLIWP